MTPEMWGIFLQIVILLAFGYFFTKKKISHVGHQERSFHSVVEIGSTHQHLGFVTDRL